MRWLVLLLISFNANAYDQKQDAIVQGVIHDAKRHNYSTEEIKWAIKSNVFEVPNIVICAYLPSLQECL